MLAVVCLPTLKVFAFDKRGLVDAENKIIIPFKFKSITELTPGFFICKLKDAYDFRPPKNPGPEWTEIYDRNGHKIDILLPKNCEITSAHLSHAKNISTYRDFIKHDAFMVICDNSRKSGLIDGTGKVILEPKYASVQLTPNPYNGGEVEAVGAMKDGTRTIVPLGFKSDRTDRKWPTAYGFGPVPDALLKKFPRPCRVNRINDTRYLISHQIDHSEFAGSQISGDDFRRLTAELPPPKVVDASGNRLATMPVHSQPWYFSKNGFSCIVNLGPPGEPTAVSELFFADSNGKITNRVKALGIGGGWEGGELIVLAIGDKPKTPSWDEHVVHGVIRKDGTWAIPPEYNNFVVVSPDRIVKTAFPSRFDSEDSKKDPAYLGENLWLLLKDHNVIGMSEKELLDVIGGKPEKHGFLFVRSYALNPGFGCGNGMSFIEFYGIYDHIVAWRIGRKLALTNMVASDNSLEDLHNK